MTTTRALLRPGLSAKLPVVLLTAFRPIAMAARVTPPVAARRPHIVPCGKVAGENRGENPMDPAIELNDDYFWLRDDKREEPEVLDHLRAENAYTERVTEHLSSFRNALYDEMLGHVQEDYDEFPSPAPDGFEYWKRTVKGSAFPQHMRHPRGGGDEAVILDVNAVASLPFFAETAGWDKAQCDVQTPHISPSGKLMAYAVDGSGYETYSVRFRDLETGAERDEALTETSGSICWAGEGHLFYVKMDAAHRPYQAWRHELGTEQSADVLMYEDLDELYNVDVDTSRDGSLVIISTVSTETDERRFLPTASPEAEPTLVRAREWGVKYDLTSHAPSGRLFVATNANGSVNRDLRVASLAAPSAWRPLVSADGGGAEAAVLPHSEERSIDEVTAFDTFLAVEGRENGFTQVWLVPLDGAEAEPSTKGESCSAAGEAHRVRFEADAFTVEVWPSQNRLFASGGKLRVQYSSMVSPRALLEYDVSARESVRLRQVPVPNYEPSLYATRTMEAVARDGVTIPITLLWRKDSASPEAGAAPTHLYGYGSYGICMDPEFSATRLPLVDRGVVYAIAHVRGGGEMGHHTWYEKQGKYLTKRNTFTDFIDVAHHLLDAGVARRGALTCEGRSAGGLLMGNVVNLAPELWAGAVAGVPFVDLMASMSDPTIPLTTEEWEEWGNPNEDKFFEYMKSYCPISNVVPGQTYPPILIVSGLNDPRVGYWEPAKWAQTLRRHATNGEQVLLKMDLSAGHFSANDRYRKLRELSFDYAWLLERLAKSPSA